MSVIGQVLSRIGDSKTYVLLVLIALLAFVTCIIASAAFGQHLWDRLFDLLMVESGSGAVRAAAVDGAPKVAAAWQNPDSTAANPPSAMLQMMEDEKEQDADFVIPDPTPIIEVEVEIEREEEEE